MQAEDYLVLKKQVVNEVTGKLNKNGAVRIRDLAYLLYYAAAFFKDGHTSVRWTEEPSQKNTGGMRFPPFLLRFRNGKFFIGEAVDRRMTGLEVIAINGVPVLQFLKPILDRCSGETLPSKATSFVDWNQQFWWFFADLLSHAMELQVTLAERSGAPFDRSLGTVAFDAFHALARAQRHADKGATQHSFLADGKIALLTCPQFNYSEHEKEIVDRIFRDIRDRNAQALIMDIRGNSGGDSRMGDFIFQYMTQKRFKPVSKMRVKISQQLLKNEYRDFSNLGGLTITKFGTERDFPKPEALFRGGIWLLIDNGTYSSATMFAAMFRDYEVGEIVGYETGGLPTHFGDQLLMTLKNSGIPYRVSYKTFYSPYPKPGDDEHGVIPNVPITDDVLEKYRDRDDPILAFTIKRILNRYKIFAPKL